MKFNYKKISSVIACLGVIANIGLASAVYPAPFKENGVVDGSAIVVGSAGADMAAALDLSQSLSNDKIEVIGDTLFDVDFDGENYPLFTASSKLFLQDPINEVRSVLTYKELPTLLDEGNFDGDVSADYTQRIEISDEATVEYAQQPDSNDEPTIGISLDTSDAAIYTSVIRFNKDVNFVSEDSKGEPITLFGQKYTVGSSTDSDELVLFKSSETIDLSLGGDNAIPLKKVMIADNEYTLELVIGSDDSSTIKVTDSNGDSDIKELDEGESRKIQGVEVGLNRADESDALNRVTAEITLGAEKIIFKDGQEVRIGSDEDSVDGTEVEFEGDVDALRAIKINVFEDDSDLDAITDGDPFVDPVFNTFKLEFLGLGDSDSENIEVFKSDDDVMSISMEDNQGNDKTFEWFSEGVLADNDGNAIHVVENESIVEDEYVVVGNEEEGYLLKLEQTDLDNSLYSNNEITFTNVFDSGEDFDATIDGNETATLYVGGKTYSIVYNDSSVMLNYPDSADGSTIVYPTIQTSTGALVSFYTPLTNVPGTIMIPNGNGYGVGSNYNVTGDGNITLLNSDSIEVTNPSVIIYEEKDDVGVYGRIILQASGTGENVEVSDIDVSSTNSKFIESEDDDDIFTLLDIYGTLVIKDTSDSDSDSVEISYPDEQAYAQLYIVEGSASLTSATNSTDVDVVDTTGNMLVVKDSEIESVKDRNLIVVGGSCINTVAQKLLGYDRPVCGEEFTADQGLTSGLYMIETYVSPYNTGKIAMLVAGFDAADTASAITKVKTGDVVTTI